ncbi:hypothetical protein ACFL20_12520 [Spirochaetota bacterium]
MKSLSHYITALIIIISACGCSDIDIPGLDGYYEGYRGDTTFAVDIVQTDKNGFKGITVDMSSDEYTICSFSGEWRKSEDDTEIYFSETEVIQAGQAYIDYYYCEAIVDGDEIFGICYNSSYYEKDLYLIKTEPGINE